MLSIKDLEASINGEKILKGLDLEVSRGEVHAIMGVNGSGKSTLANVLAGREDCEVINGSIEFQGIDLLELGADERALKGVFLAFQYPVELPGVSETYFLRSAYNAHREHRGEKALGVKEFTSLLKEKISDLELSETLVSRSVNEGFSGGEKKRNEILQMSLLKPSLAILDETDSGLDIDALQIVANGINKLRNEERSFLLITHYQRLLNYIEPDYVHVMMDGRILKSGNRNLALKLENKGYGWIAEEATTG